MANMPVLVPLTTPKPKQPGQSQKPPGRRFVAVRPPQPPTGITPFSNQPVPLSPFEAANRGLSSEQIATASRPPVPFAGPNANFLRGTPISRNILPFAARLTGADIAARQTKAFLTGGLGGAREAQEKALAEGRGGLTLDDIQRMPAWEQALIGLGFAGPEVGAVPSLFEAGQAAQAARRLPGAALRAAPQQVGEAVQRFGQDVGMARAAKPTVLPKVNLGDASSMRIKRFLNPDLQTEYERTKRLAESIGWEMDAVAGPQQGQWFVMFDKPRGIPAAELLTAADKAGVPRVRAIGNLEEKQTFAFRNFEEANSFLHSSEPYKGVRLEFSRTPGELRQHFEAPAYSEGVQPRPLVIPRMKPGVATSPLGAPFANVKRAPRVTQKMTPEEVLQALARVRASHEAGAAGRQRALAEQHRRADEFMRSVDQGLAPPISKVEIPTTPSAASPPAAPPPPPAARAPSREAVAKVEALKTTLTGTPPPSIREGQRALPASRIEALDIADATSGQDILAGVHARALQAEQETLQSRITADATETPPAAVQASPRVEALKADIRRLKDDIYTWDERHQHGATDAAEARVANTRRILGAKEKELADLANIPPAAASPAAQAHKTPPAEPPGGAPPPTGGTPPVAEGGGPPSIPPAKPPESAATPPAAPSESARIIAQAQEVVRQDRPGAISALMQKIPGVKQAREFERPGLKLSGENEKLLVGHVAETAARSDVAARALASRVQVGERLAKAFGKDALSGGKVPVQFLGTADDAASPLTGTLKDIADNPQLYRLSPEQSAALQALDDRNTSLLNHVVSGYGAEVGEYQAKAGGAFLPNVDISEDVIRAMGGETRAVASGRGKTRFYPSARDRMAHDSSFKPELDVNKLIDGLDRFKASAAGGQTFREAVGGLTKLEAMQKTHPALAAKMETLKAKLASLKGTAARLGGKQAEAIDDFLASPLDEVDLAALQADLHPTVGANAVGVKGRNFGKDLAALNAEVAEVKADVAALRPAWEIANLKPYEFVQDGIYRYFPGEQAELIRELRKQTNNPLLNFLEGWRGGAFSGDVSPLVGVQTPLGALFDPLGQFKAGIGAVAKAVQERNILRSFSIKALAEDVAKDTETWTTFFSLMGRAPSGAPSEFAGGYLSRLPGFSRFTEGTFIAVTRQAKGMWERMTADLASSGVSRLEAQVVAAGKVSEVFPLLSPARLGQSPARQSLLRALPTSYSFIRQPASLMAQATRGFAKVATKQTLTPAERLAMRLMLTLAGSVAAASVSSAVISAHARGKDIKQAALDAVNPDPSNGKFASLVMGSVRIPIGGPYRALFRAIYPGEVAGVPVVVPFARLPSYFQNRLNPAVSTQLRLYKNKDYFGNSIRSGDFPKQLLNSVRYEAEGAAPLTLGTLSQELRGKASGKEAVIQVAGQFAGGNVAPTETYRQRMTELETSGGGDPGASLPGQGTSLPALLTAYRQAGEGLLSEAGRKAWEQYEPLPSVERKRLLQTFQAQIRAEVLRTEAYRTQRRKALSSTFPQLDVELVNEAWNARPQRSYTPKTAEGRQRLQKLRGSAPGPQNGTAPKAPTGVKPPGRMFIVVGAGK